MSTPVTTAPQPEWINCPDCGYFRRSDSACPDPFNHHRAETPAEHSRDCCHEWSGVVNHSSCGSWCVYCAACCKPQTESLNVSAGHGTGAPPFLLKAILESAKDALCVAINELYATHPDDVVKRFTVWELQYVAKRVDRLQPQHVEDIYRVAFENLVDRSEIRRRISHE